METKTLKISELKLNNGNPRRCSDEKFKRLINSLLVFPDMMRKRPIVINAEREVLGGNQRLRALRHLAQMSDAEIENAMAKAPDTQKMSTEQVEQCVNFWKSFADTKCVEVIDASEWTDEEQKQFVIKDNATFGEWDYDMLANEWDISDLVEWGVDVWETPSEKEVAIEEDELPEVEEGEPVVKRGDIWQLGNHRLMCGDSTLAEDVERLVAGEKMDLLLTDPPYNVDYTGETKDKLKIQNDKMSDTAFFEFLNAAFAAAKSVLRDGGCYYIWCSGKEYRNFFEAVKQNDFHQSIDLVWVKNHFVMSQGDYHAKHEICMYGWKKGAPHFWASDRKQTTVLEFDKPAVNAEHPTMKPVALFGYQMQNNTHKGDKVLDLFAGSGTTIIAAEQLERVGYCMELDPKYCDVIIARWEKATGKKAVLIFAEENEDEQVAKVGEEVPCE